MLLGLSRMTVKGALHYTLYFTLHFELDLYLMFYDLDGLIE